MSERMQILEEAQTLITKYTHIKPWRPGLIDLYAYTTIINMHDNDYTDDNVEYIWRKTPDEVMAFLVEDTKIFDLEYGWDQFDEDIREYLLENEFIVSCDDVTEEEYKENLERNK